MIIGITGQKGAGKDTIADYLVSEYGFIKVGFADALKGAVAQLFILTDEQVERFKENDAITIWANSKDFPLVSLTTPLTMRIILQRMGTEVGRELFGENFWVHLLAAKIDKVQNYVIKDVRFENEADMVENFAGHMWRVLRPGYEGDDHASEQEQRNLRVEMEIWNGSDINSLHKAVDEIMEVGYGFQRVSS